MQVRFQRLFIILISLVFLTASVLLILINSKKNLVFFYTPSEFKESNLNVKDSVRIGGFVKKNSVNNKGNNSFSFIITDNKKEIIVFYNGILPNLFKEEQGVVIEGYIVNKEEINATSVFAKHDENYMPASIKQQLKNKSYWKKNYK